MIPVECYSTSLLSIQREIFEQALVIYEKDFFYNLKKVSKCAQILKTRRLQILRCLTYYLKKNDNFIGIATSVDTAIEHLGLDATKGTGTL